MSPGLRSRGRTRGSAVLTAFASLSTPSPSARHRTPALTPASPPCRLRALSLAFLAHDDLPSVGLQCQLLLRRAHSLRQPLASLIGQSREQPPPRGARSGRPQRRSLPPSAAAAAAQGGGAAAEERGGAGPQERTLVPHQLINEGVHDSFIGGGAAGADRPSLRRIRSSGSGCAADGAATAPFGRETVNQCTVSEVTSAFLPFHR